MKKEEIENPFNSVLFVPFKMSAISLSAAKFIHTFEGNNLGWVKPPFM